MKNLMASNENTLEAVKLENNLKETSAYENEQRNKKVETLESAHILASDIHMRIILLEAIVEELQRFSPKGESESFLIFSPLLVSIATSRIDLKVDEDFYMNKIKLLPDDLAMNVVWIYKMFNSQNLYDMESYKNQGDNELNKILEPYNSVLHQREMNNEEADAFFLQLNTAMLSFKRALNKAVFNGYIFQCVTTICYGYDALMKLNTLMKNFEQAKECESKSDIYEKRYEQLESVQANLDEQYMKEFNALLSLLNQKLSGKSDNQLGQFFEQSQ